ADSMRFRALGDSGRVFAQAIDSLGSPLPDSVTGVAVLDTSIANADARGVVHARLNGATTIVFSVGGMPARMTVAVRQVPVTLAVSPMTDDSILRPALSDLLPIVCTASDANGYAIPASVIQASSLHGVAVGNNCSEV